MNRTPIRALLALTSLFVLFVASSCRHSPEGPRTDGPPRFRYGFSRVLDLRPSRVAVAPPRRPGVAYLELYAIGDQGTGLPGQRLVARRMAELARKEAPSLILLLGDNIYPKGVRSVDDPQWQTKFEAIYIQPELQVPFYATLGNHDYRSKPDAEVAYTDRSACRCSCTAERRCDCRRLVATRKCWIMPRRYYSFHRRIDATTDVHFIALDTTPIAYPRYYPKQAAPQIAWLERELKSSTARWKVVFGHHPIVSGGQHGPNRPMRDSIRPLLERYGVQLYLCGHDHDLQLLRPNGSPTTYVVSGGGGKSRDVRYIRDSLFAATNFGFVSIRLSADEALIRFFDRAGELRFAYPIERKTAKR
ncbi:MAG: metallophosphoesterase [Myxococcales bacterium]|nr:metallophosphoesterase [Myxococcales bacterium]